MSKSRSIGAFMPRIALARPSPACEVVATKSVSPRNAFQGEHFEADTSWVPLMRGPFKQREMARLGPTAIAIYVALKTRIDIRTGKATASVGALAKDVGITDRTAREALRTLEEESLIEVEHLAGRRALYQFTERLQIVNAEGHPIGTADWPFHPREWQQRLNQAIEAAKEQFKADGTSTTNIQIGTVNVLIVASPGQK